MRSVRAAKRYKQYSGEGDYLGECADGLNIYEDGTLVQWYIGTDGLDIYEDGTQAQAQTYCADGLDVYGLYSGTVVQWYSSTVVQIGLIYMDGTQADHAGPLHSAVVGVECTCLTFLHRVFSNCLLKLPAYGDAKLHWLHVIDFSPLCIFK